MNPLFGLHEYILDGEPHVFGDRLYLYGSHDEAHGAKYSPGDYVLWSCPVSDLQDWRCDGVIYRKNQDPANPDGKLCLYAPDVVEGPDGCYYLYYGLESRDMISVAKSSVPEGPFEFYGYVRWPEGVDKEALPDHPYAFDPGLFREGDRVYLAMGFSVDFAIAGMDLNEKNMRGAYIVELEEDMLTMKHIPVFAVPGCGRGKGTSFEGHEFLEASSLRKYGDTYCFIYSSQHQHELCYAAAYNILGPYVYQGVLISNAWENGFRNNWANNHGSTVRIGVDDYVFYHRHTCGTQYSRQACAEKILFRNGHFETAEVTCQGIAGDVLPPGSYPAGIACFVCDGDGGSFIPFGAEPMDTARIEGDNIVNITQSTIVFRYFADVQCVTLHLTDAADGSVKLYMKGSLQDESALKHTVRLYGVQHDTDVTLVFSAQAPVILERVEIEGSSHEAL